jgi:hypothetical protein
MKRRSHQIFVSHSKSDSDLECVYAGFSTTGVKSIFMEYEKMDKPAWQSIRKNILISESVFVLLSNAVRDREHTQNWIAFEVGVACQAKKNVWVFERSENYINFAVPYLTHFLAYHPSKDRNIKLLREIIKTNGIGKDWGDSVHCFNCGTVYKIPNINKWFCPCCRLPLKRSESTIEKKMGETILNEKIVRKYQMEAKRYSSEINRIAWALTHVFDEDAISKCIKWKNAGEYRRIRWRCKRCDTVSPDIKSTFLGKTRCRNCGGEVVSVLFPVDENKRMIFFGTSP